MRDIQTQAVDLAPTLAHLAGVDPPDGLEGIDIWRDLQGKGEGEPVAYAELPGKLYMLRTREWKLISNLEAHYELYHLTSDPREQHNRAPFEPDRVEKMRNQLAAILAKAYDVGARVHGQFAPISPRVLNRLRSLGYIH
jgi:arylsulfatase A-like enzyme